MDFYSKILEHKKSKGITNKELGAIIGKKEPAFRIALKRQSLSDLEIEKLENYFDKNEQSTNIDERLKDKNKIIHLLEEQVKKDNYIKELLSEVQEMKKTIIFNSISIDEIKDYWLKYYKSKSDFK